MAHWFLKAGRPDSYKPGLKMEEDGRIYKVASDGTETEVGVESGGSQPIASISAENSDGTIVLPQGTDVAVDGLTLDAQNGDEGTLGVDGKTFTLAAGTYHIQESVFLGGGVGTTGVRFPIEASGVFQSPSGASLNGAMVPLAANGSAYASGTITLPVGRTLFFRVTASGGSGDDTLGYFGVDIVRLGDVAP